MSRILFVVSSERGHVNPCIGPAYHLQQKGHSVAFYSMYSISEQLKKAGFKTFFSAKSESPPPATANRGNYFAEQIKDADWCKFSLKTSYVDRVALQVETLSKVVSDFSPDVMAVDPKVYEAAIVAETKKRPWATLSPSLTMVSPDILRTELGETVKWFDRDRDALFDSFGVKAKFRFSDCLSPHLNICFTTDKLIGNASVSDVKRVGPALPTGDRGDECDFPWKELDDKVPLVYVWLGSQTFYQPGIMRNIMDAVKGKEVQLVCAASELAGTLRLEFVPKNVIILQQTPQLSILQSAAAHITHGGAASVMESIAMGVPMLVSPMYDDQAHQAHFIDKCGVGERHDLSRLDSNECWKAIRFLLESPRIKQTMEELRLSYKKHDGSAQAARLIERLA